jgi:YihY family inner membrane protein
MPTGAGSGLVERIDGWQQRHRVSAVTVAAAKQFQEDSSANLAALLAFWTFFSIFPLMLAAATLLGWFLPDVSDDVIDTINSYVPLIDFSDRGIGGSWWALALGLVTALWGATRAARAARFAFDSVWGVPHAEQAGIVRQSLDGLLAFGLIGLAIILSVLITGFVSGTSEDLDIPAIAVAGGYVIAIVIDVVVFVIAFRILTSRDVTVRNVLPGAALTGVGFWILQSLSSLIIARYLQNAQATYGNFATVITLLWWFYLTGILVLVGAQLNAVLEDRRWPRSLRSPASST